MRETPSTPVPEAPILATIDHERHEIGVATIDGAGVRALGPFRTAADAWRAVDAFDVGELGPAD